MKTHTLGIDIGGTKCAVALGGAQIPQGETSHFILDRQAFSTNTHLGLEYTLSCLYDAIDSILARNQLEPAELLGIGISCGGPLDHRSGIIYNPPNLYGWVNVPIVRLLEERYHVPAFLQNDANACALAEWKFGAARNYSNVVFLTFGTGMGAGLILNGQLYCGANGMAGEVGHVRISSHGPVGFGKSGSFEGFCSGNGIAQLAKIKVMEALQRGEVPSFCPTIADMDSLDAKLVAEAAGNGDPLAIEIYEICGENLGKGLSILIDILNPEVIVLGSIFQRSAELLWPAAKRVIAREALPQSFRHCKVVPARLGNQIGDYAAISIVLTQSQEVFHADTQ